MPHSGAPENPHRDPCLCYRLKSSCEPRYVNCSERRQSRRRWAFDVAIGGLRVYDELDFAALVQEDAQSGHVAYSRQIHLSPVPSRVPGSLGRPGQPIGIRPVAAQGQSPGWFACFCRLHQPAASVHHVVDICQHFASMDLCAWVSTPRQPAPWNGPRSKLPTWVPILFRYSPRARGCGGYACPILGK
jgi:hypothetical protein